VSVICVCVIFAGVADGFAVIADPSPLAMALLGIVPLTFAAAVLAALLRKLVRAIVLGRVRFAVVAIAVVGVPVILTVTVVLLALSAAAAVSPAGRSVTAKCAGVMVAA